MKDGENGKNESQEELDFQQESGNEAAMQESAGSGMNQDLGAQDLDEDLAEEDQSQLSQIKSLVGADPKKNMAMLIVLGVALFGIVYYFFLKDDSTSKGPAEESIPLEKKSGRNVSSIAPPTIRGSATPSPSYDIAIDPEKLKLEEQKKAQQAKIEAAKIAAAKAAKIQQAKVLEAQKKEQPDFPQNPNFEKAAADHLEKPHIKTKSDVKAQQSKSTKLKSSIMLVGGNNKGSAESSNGRSVTTHFAPETSSAPVSKLTKIGNMSHMITQGKVVETVLETPINTNYPGPIRAVVSRDVYSEYGENVLIPRGSRVIGNMAGGYTAGQTRVIVTWDRIILPSGYDIKVQAAPGVDKLGMVGLEGIVDRQLWNTLGNAVLLSAVNIGLAKVVEAELGAGSSTSTTTVNNDGTQTTNHTSSPVQDSAKTELNNISGVLKQWLTQNFITKPSISIDQGTIVKVFVNADIQFPSNISTGVDILK